MNETCKIPTTFVRHTYKSFSRFQKVKVSFSHPNLFLVSNFITSLKLLSSYTIVMPFNTKGHTCANTWFFLNLNKRNNTHTKNTKLGNFYVTHKIFKPIGLPSQKGRQE
jgi:hypothetical protein